MKGRNTKRGIEDSTSNYLIMLITVSYKSGKWKVS